MENIIILNNDRSKQQDPQNIKHDGWSKQEVAFCSLLGSLVTGCKHVIVRKHWLKKTYIIYV